MFARGGKRLDDSNLQSYIEETYEPITDEVSEMIKGYTPLLQRDYGKANDCTLTCITAMLSTGNPEVVYKKVESIAKKYFYDGDKFGTIPFFIKSILDESAAADSESRYGKGVGFNWSDIKKLIKQNKPIILSLVNDGRGYYMNHSITIAGYKEFNKGKIRILAVYDNWRKTIAYLDFNKLPTICSINYL